MPPPRVELSSVAATGQVGRPGFAAVGTPELAELVWGVGAGVLVGGGLWTARVPAVVTAAGTGACYLVWRPWRRSEPMAPPARSMPPSVIRMLPASDGLSSLVTATGRVGGPGRPAFTAVGTPELAELVRRVGAGIVVRTCGGLGTARPGVSDS